MQIVQYPHPALRWVSKPVREVNDAIRKISRDMFELMYTAKGVGLAANQVALPLRLFVINSRSEPVETEQERVFINPQIVERKGIVEEEEGCLSLPGVFGKLKRAERVKVAALGLDGQPFELEAEGLLARAIQHEVDHLQGVVFTDKLTPLEKLRVIAKIREFERTFRHSQQAGEIASNAILTKQLADLESAYC